MEATKRKLLIPIIDLMQQRLKTTTRSRPLVGLRHIEPNTPREVPSAYASWHGTLTMDTLDHAMKLLVSNHSWRLLVVIEYYIYTLWQGS